MTYTGRLCALNPRNFYSGSAFITYNKMTYARAVVSTNRNNGTHSAINDVLADGFYK